MRSVRRLSDAASASSRSTPRCCEDVDTVGGWLYDQIGQTPRVGQMAAAGGNLFYVEEVDGVRITRVLIHCAEDREKEQDEIVDMP